jgi:ornithine carbamoyltransferase
MTVRHFLEVDDLTPAELTQVLDLSEATDLPKALDGKGAALVFEKPSLRTRSSSELAVVQLGGHPVTIGATEVGLGTRETPEDVLRVLAGYHAVVCARVFEHEKLERMAAVGWVPVVNLLSDDGHPVQALADLLTLRQRFGSLEGRTVAYVGDPNNVSRSLSYAAAMSGMAVRIASPAGYPVPPADIARVIELGGTIEVTDDPAAAAEGVDAVYTDVWASMGKEDEAEARRRDFAGFTIDEALMSGVAPDGVFLHCLPAHRGEEVSHEVLESERSLVWKQAENRMHTMRGLLAFLLGARA